MNAIVDRALGFLAIGLVVTVCAALGGWWWIDRRVPYEPPRWNEARFEALDRTVEPIPVDEGTARVRHVERRRADRETWVVPVNPTCSHCLATLSALADTLAATPRAPRLFALVVDSPRRPAERAVAHPRLEGVFWDRDQVWRAKWGHRVYGEVMRFDGTGRFIADARWSG